MRKELIDHCKGVLIKEFQNLDMLFNQYLMSVIEVSDSEEDDDGGEEIAPN